MNLLRLAAEPARTHKTFAFFGSDLPERIRDALIQLRVHDKFHRMPPADVLYLHRKISGLYLLLARLKATLPVRQLILDTLKQESHEH